MEVLHKKEIKDRFEELNRILLKYEGLWRPRPFVYKTLPWEKDFPEMTAKLKTLSMTDARYHDDNPQKLHELLAPFIPDLQEIQDSYQIGEFPENDITSRLSRDAHKFTPGRKWEQVNAFAKRVERDLPFIEWCSGKGHLARVLQMYYDQKSFGFEIQKDLCEKGEALADRFKLDLKLFNKDVLKDDLSEFLNGKHHVVALHACGGLHRKLLQSGCQNGLNSMTVVPCCFHHHEEETYQPYSQQAQQSDLKLDRKSIRLCLQETVTARSRIIRERQMVVLRRLAFDCLQRDVRGVDDYITYPSFPTNWLKLEFAEFCRSVAELAELPLPENVDFEKYLRMGEKRLEEASPKELPRLLFRRPLELWLILDRALYLTENGYDVSVGTFCDRKMTPRNLMIKAKKGLI